MHHDLLSLANVVGVGHGYKTKDGQIELDSDGNPIECLVVSVETKKPLAELASEDVVPVEIDGESTDVIEIGVVSALSDVDPQQRVRPIVPGLSIGLNPGVTAGTLGFFVLKKGSSIPYLLSNWHVIATNNTPVEDRDVLTITQPGNYDGGSVPADVIALLAEFIPISTGGLPIPSECNIASAVAAIPNFLAWLTKSDTRLAPVVGALAATDNLVDAALGQVAFDVEVSNVTPHIGTVSGTVTPQLGMKVQKFGRTTGYTVGTITQVNMTVNVSGYPGGPALFVDQVAITADEGPFLQGGDSGSGLVSMDGKAAGLCFAGSDVIGIANTWPNVEAALGIVLA